MNTVHLMQYTDSNSLAINTTWAWLPIMIAKCFSTFIRSAVNQNVYLSYLITDILSIICNWYLFAMAQYTDLLTSLNRHLYLSLDYCLILVFLRITSDYYSNNRQNKSTPCFQTRLCSKFFVCFILSLHPILFFLLSTQNLGLGGRLAFSAACYFTYTIYGPMKPSLFIDLRKGGQPVKLGLVDIITRHKSEPQ